MDPIIRVFKKKLSLFRERVEDYGVEKMKDQVQQLRILNQNLEHQCIQVYLAPCVSRSQVYLEPFVSRYTLNPVYPGIP